VEWKRRENVDHILRKREREREWLEFVGVFFFWYLIGEERREAEGNLKA
jgi:hypothetical protein